MPQDAESEHTELLIEALLSLKTREECAKLLTDLCTPREIKDLSQRITVAQMLRERITYNEIAQRVGTSTATICRVNRCLQYDGTGGYELVLSRIEASE